MFLAARRIVIELINREQELPAVVARICESECAANASRAMREYLRPEERLQVLTERLRKS